MKKRIIEEEKNIRENIVEKLCEVENDDHLRRIMKIIKPLLRNKRRAIQIMGENYDEFNKDT